MFLRSYSEGIRVEINKAFIENNMKNYKRANLNKEILNDLKIYKIPKYLMII